MRRTHERTDPDVTQLALAAAACLAGGALTLYLLDPDLGRRRRAGIRDKTVGGLNDTRASADRLARHTANRTRGLFATMSRLFAGCCEEVSDATLAARVRSALGRSATHPDAIRVVARGGAVTLYGTVPADEHAGVVAAMAKAPGVRNVDDRLQTYDRAHDPYDAPSADQGNAAWSPAARLAAAVGGVMATLAGLRRGGLLGALATCGGACLGLRALTNLSLSQLTGIGAGRRAVDVRKTVTIAAPRDLVFGFFSSYEGFPMFMSNVREVKDYGDGRSHWTVAGPGGMTVQWEAVITDYVPHELLAWKSVDGSTVEHAGVIRFTDDPAFGGTHVDVRLSYNPPGGALGHFLAKLFGADPKSEMDADLARVKSALETNNPPQDAADPIVMQAGR